MEKAQELIKTETNAVMADVTKHVDQVKEEACLSVVDNQR
jgi:hypothetical protein